MKALRRGFGLMFLLSGVASAADSHLEGYKADPNELVVAQASIAKASQFLETVALKWTRQNHCGTCHTNLAYMIARPDREPTDAAVSDEIRNRLFAYLSEYNPGPVAPEHKHDNDNMYWNRLPIVAAIAIGDAEQHRAQDKRTLARFDDIWAMQSADGSFAWPKLPLPFLEGDAYYVNTLVALGAAHMPADYLKTPAAARGTRDLTHYLTTNPPKDLHGEIMLMRASLKAPALMTPARRAAVIDKALALQRPDGGWRLASLGDWPRQDGSANEKTGPSDGYGTGFVLTALCEAGQSKDSPAVQKGIAWLASHQRESGRWFTASLWSGDFHNYVSTIGTAYDVMALKECRR
jgi:squalene-hopene/tetraprenyl-beta-curcumene cyclase